MNADAASPPGCRFLREEDGTGWIVIDDPASRANLLGRALRKGLGAALDAALASHQEKALRRLAIRSAKRGIFSAGADLNELRCLPDAAAAEALSREGQALFGRLAAFPVPTVCIIEGACAGGGFELALACSRRIAADMPETRVGLTERSVGALPGWGGTVRLPALIGQTAAEEHIQRARLVPAREALEAGLVDEVVGERGAGKEVERMAPTCPERSRGVRLDAVHLRRESACGPCAPP